MEKKTGNPRRSRYERLMNGIAIAVLGIGLASAAAVFVLAPPEAPEEGGAYVASVDNSKRYQLELERIGGRSAVVAAQFNDWFETLWHGRRLAGTIALVSAAVALLIFLAASLPSLDD